MQSTAPENRVSAIPLLAATVIVLEDTPQDGLRVLLVRRNAKSRFMPGTTVFPGGKVDKSDHDPKWLSRFDDRLATDDDAPDAIALRVAANRELFEESGLFLGAAAKPRQLSDARTRLLANDTTFLAVVEAIDARFSMGRMLHWAHWRTPSLETRRFDAHFFVVRAPPEEHRARLSIDSHETTDIGWYTPQQALSAHADGTMMLPPPTWFMVEELAHMNSVDAVFEACRARQIACVLPKLVTQTDPWTILMPWDRAYPAAPGESVRVPSPHPARRSYSRLKKRGDAWFAEEGETQ